MTDFIFPPPRQVALPVAGRGSLFPVRRVLCVGRNYDAHRREMGGDERDPPFFFAKPTDALVPPGRPVHYPAATHDLQHEIELVVAIGDDGEAASADGGEASIFGFAVGVDLTRRDLQSAAKAKCQPWEAGKGFDHSAPISAIHPWRGAAPRGRIWLSVNGEIRQDALVADMIWSVTEVVSQAASLWRLTRGDLIFTGTPEGVGRLVVGDQVEGGVEGVDTLAFAISGQAAPALPLGPRQ